MTAATAYLERLIRFAAADGRVTAAYVGGALAREEADPFGELDLYLVAPDGVQPDLPGWLEPLGGTAFIGITAAGCRLVTPDGLAINIALAGGPEAIAVEGLRPVFNRGTGSPSRPGMHLPDDLAQEAARFWDGLYRAAAEIGRGRPFSAHGELECCRERLIDLYRLALAPGRTGAGWAGADLLPGGEQILEGMRGWLVCPLEIRAQWRCATRLATTYESLMLPLLERLDLPYPMAMRNLAFRRLDEVRPDRNPEGEPVPPPPPPEPEAPRPPSGPMRVKSGKIRRPGQEG